MTCMLGPVNEEDRKRDDDVFVGAPLVGDLYGMFATK